MAASGTISSETRKEGLTKTQVLVRPSLDIPQFFPEALLSADS